MNVSRTQAGVEENFGKLSDEYNRVGLNFNHSKSEILVFNRRCQDPVAVSLGVHVIQDQERLTYLGVPIGNNLHSYTSFLLKDFLRIKLGRRMACC